MRCNFTKASSRHILHQGIGSGTSEGLTQGLIRSLRAQRRGLRAGQAAHSPLTKLCADAVKHALQLSFIKGTFCLKNLAGALDRSIHRPPHCPAPDCLCAPVNTPVSALRTPRSDSSLNTCCLALALVMLPAADAPPPPARPMPPLELETRL